MLKSLHLNGISWRCFPLGENALLLETNEDVEPKVIHEITRSFESASLKNLADIVPAYNSVTLVFDHPVTSPQKKAKQIVEKIRTVSEPPFEPKLHRVSVCYEMGMDWEYVIRNTGLSKESIIKKHMNEKYEVAMLGFLPGFIYLSGLNDAICCPRKKNPHPNIPAGSVGIGGNQAGIYALQSPGGWPIIGRTPASFFNINASPITKIKSGDKVVFQRISEAEFQKREEEVHR